MYKIATLASHSALTILSGAKEQGFETVLFVNKEREEFYRSFDIADEYVVLDSYEEILEKCDHDTIIIPHGSFVAYVPLEDILDSDLRIFGNRELLKWEADRELKDDLLKDADIPIPTQYGSIDNANFPIMVKFHGADGGRGYFIARSEEEYKEKLNGRSDAFIQQFVVGTKVYTTFFNSIIRDQLEIFGTDVRYESDIDAQVQSNGDPAFQIVGNLPMVLRESLLYKYYEMGKRFCGSVSGNIGTKMIGPFCLETVVDRNLDIYTFEFSGRIVAGTNIFVPSSPYTYIKHGENMSMGKRIAIEIKEAIEQDRLDEVTL